MCKIKLIIFAIGLAFSAQGFSQVLFYEDFGPSPLGDPPGSWQFGAGFVKRNVDTLVPNATVSWVNEAWEVREDFGLSVVDAVAFSTSWYNPVAQSNDWMWTPLIGPISATTILSWNARAYDPSYPDGYEVRIMTSASGPPTGGGGVIGNQITNSTVVFSIPAEQTTWINRQYNLSAYAGQSVYVGFRNPSNDQFLLVIDDIKVESFFYHDAQVTNADTVSEYTMIPKIQVSPLPLMGTIANVGVNALTNVGMKVNVYDGAMTQIYTNTSPLQNLAIGANANFNAGTWTPPAVAGTYTLKFFPVSTPSDENGLNDTITKTVVITDSTYARDDGTAVSQLGIGAGNGGFLGQEFAIYNQARLTSIDVYYTQGHTGERFGAVVWAMSGGFPSTIVAYTDTLLYPDDSADFYTIPMDGGEYIINPGNYAITVVEFDSTIAVGLTNSIFTTNRTWVDWPTNPQSPWGNNEDYGGAFAKSYMIRPHMMDLCPPDIITSTGSTPAGCGLLDGTASVTTTGSGPFTYSWSSGGTGVTENGLAAGTYYVTVTDQMSFCTETDSVTIVNPSPPSSSITASSNESCAACNDGSATVTASGGTGGYTYSWAPSGGTAATATNLAPGVYTVTVTDAANCTSTSTVTIASFNNIQDEIGLYATQVYPNPSNGMFTVTGSFDYVGEMRMEVMNVLGETIYNQVINVHNEINTSIQVHVKPGMYILRLTAGENRSSKELIIK